MASKRKQARSKKRGPRSAVAAAPAAPGKKKGGQGKRYSDAERRSILVTAKSEGLTGAAVRARFGVSTLTFYAWRKKAKAGRPRSAAPKTHSVSESDLAGALRKEVQAQIAQLLPAIVSSEIEAALKGEERHGRGKR